MHAVAQLLGHVAPRNPQTPATCRAICQPPSSAAGVSQWNMRDVGRDVVGQQLIHHAVVVVQALRDSPGPCRRERRATTKSTCDRCSRPAPSAVAHPLCRGDRSRPPHRPSRRDRFCPACARRHPTAKARGHPPSRRPQSGRPPSRIPTKSPWDKSSGSGMGSPNANFGSSAPVDAAAAAAVITLPNWRRE